MRKIILSTAALAAVAVALPAAAQSMSAPSYYVNGGYGHYEAEDADASLGAITGRFGARFTPNFGAEAEASFGVAGEEIGAVDVDLNYDAAIYAVGFLPVTPNLELLGRIGYGTTELEASTGGVSVSESESSWNFGVGAQYMFDGMNGVRGDYTRREFNDDAGSADVWSIAYVRKF
ncbi:porin family protein [Brevundimonas sp. 2R-24]|uniref:Porin family protein n=1 Tax=Peiella sedimenti TaxID=3061083 RepID=A0ABT8SK59_9CAUL|nr:porin family protein [Caulobacteraceae bacterium XZ-24]